MDIAASLHETGLSQAECEYLVANCPLTAYKQGTTIADEELERTLFYVLKGLVKVDLLEQDGKPFSRFIATKHFFPFGRCCQKKSFIKNQYYFMAWTDVVALKINPHALRALEAMNLRWKHVLFEDCFYQGTISKDMTLAVSQPAAPDRIWMTILALAHYFGDTRQGFVYLPRTFTRDMIANIANSTLPTISKTLRAHVCAQEALTRRGVIAVHQTVLKKKYG